MIVILGLNIISFFSKVKLQPFIRSAMTQNTIIYLRIHFEEHQCPVAMPNFETIWQDWLKLYVFFVAGNVDLEKLSLPEGISISKITGKNSLSISISSK